MNKAQILFHLKRRVTQLERGAGFRSAVQQAEADMPYSERRQHIERVSKQRESVKAELDALREAAQFIEANWKD